MSEPKATAAAIDVVMPGLLHWTVDDDRIGSRSDAWALTNGPDTVLVDPLPLEPDALGVLGAVRLVVLTIQSHQRSAWRLRAHFKVPVFAPRGSVGLEQEPDYWYEDGAELPGGLRAIHAPGPCEASYAIHLPRGDGGVAFVGDLLIRPAPDGPVEFVPSEYLDDPARARESARRLLAVAPAVVCPGHGAPILEHGADAIRQAIERDAAR
jgi:glyoxylase-like metal-dependent hydrolase (beta-lactamase superfamily II)